MKPRIDGTDAAVDAPSRMRVAAEQDEVRRQERQDHRDEPEDGPELHDPVVAPAIGQQAERGRQQQLGGVERRGHQTPSATASTLGPPCAGQVGQVVDQQRARQARAEPEGERPEQDRAERAREVAQDPIDDPGAAAVVRGGLHGRKGTRAARTRAYEAGGSVHATTREGRREATQAAASARRRLD